MGGVPSRRGLPRYLAPLPVWLENLGLRLAWLLVAVNLAGTAFGFWYYGLHPVPVSDPLVTGQFAATHPVLWPVVPDSPVATLLFSLSLAAWKLDAGRWSEALHTLAFFGCIKLGFWTPFVQLALNGPDGIATWLYWFLILSHLGMVAQAFLIHRYASFPGWAIAVAIGWHGGNDLVDYFVPLGGDLTHTFLRAEFVGGELTHAVPAHDAAAAAAVFLTVLATGIAIATRVKICADGLRNAGTARA